MECGQTFAPNILQVELNVFKFIKKLLQIEVVFPVIVKKHLNTYALAFYYGKIAMNTNRNLFSVRLKRDWCISYNPGFGNVA
ncbi:hypothetical protein D3C72_2316170 [compost metagenome]